MSAATDGFVADLEDAITGERSTTAPATSEDEARRYAEDVIRRKPNLRVVRIHHASATISGVGALTANAAMQQGADPSLYETDTAAWAQEQSDALRRRATNEIDWNNVAEEIEDVAARHKDQIESRLSVLCEHLLKWQFQPEMRSGSWRGSVVEARDRIASVIRKNPSLKDCPAAVLPEAYPPGKRKAEAESGLPGLPETCPWTIEQVLDHAFWP